MKDLYEELLKKIGEDENTQRTVKIRGSTQKRESAPSNKRYL